MVSGVCEVCYREPAVARCRFCGRIVCESHYNSVTGSCSICSETICKICGTRLSHAYCIFCGRLGCDQCLVQLDPSRWACRECIRRVGGLKRARMLALRPRPTL